MLRSLIVVPMLTIGLALPAHAQQTSTSAAQQIADLGKKYDEAFNKHDVAALSAIFAENAVIVGEGPMLSGRQAIEENYRNFFKNGNPNPDHLTKVVEMRAMGDKAAWVVGEWSGTGPGPNNTTQDFHGNWGGVDVQENGKWVVQMLTWNRIETPPPVATGSTTPPTTTPSK
jgi:uncharacterized protein (TIGR02246 family)